MGGSSRPRSCDCSDGAVCVDTFFGLQIAADLQNVGLIPQCLLHAHTVPEVAARMHAQDVAAGAVEPSHVLRGMEWYKRRLIAYSLGNFATYRGFNVAGPLGVTGVLQLEFAPDRKLRAARFVPMKQLPRQGPFPDPEATALNLIRRLSAEDFGATAAVITDSGEILPPP